MYFRRSSDTDIYFRVSFPLAKAVNYHYNYYKSKDYSDTVTQKRCRGTLQSSKCDADGRNTAPERSHC